MINYYLRDGDEVYITLGASQPLESLSHSPSRSQWTKLAFDTTTMDDAASSKGKLTETKSGNEEDNGDSFNTANERRKRLEAETVAKARFMRIVLKTQMPNDAKIAHYIRTEWANVSSLIPQVKSPQDTEEDHAKILQIYIEHGDLLQDVFRNYAPLGYLLKENFISFVEDAQLFPTSMLVEKASKIYARVCKYMGIIPTGKSFHLCHLLCAILLLAQAKFNDTLESKQTAKKSIDAVLELFQSHFLPLARDLQLKCILKSEFTSDECLSRLRSSYDQLHSLFDKCAAKTRDIPTTVPIADVHDILYQAGLTDEKNSCNFTTQLFEDVCKTGTIFGREAVFEERGKDDDPLPVEEFTFPEFVEAIARAGYQRFVKKDESNNIIPPKPTTSLTSLHFTLTDPTSASGGGGGGGGGGEEEGENELSVVDCMVRGAVHVVESISNPNAHRKVVQSKHAGGGKMGGANRKK